jgi:hypothetical protein
MNDAAYFLSRAAKNGDCMEWEGAFDSWGAPIFKMKLDNGKWANRPVRRAMAGLLDAPMKMIATVKCGNPACIEPSHIVKMTRAKLQNRTAKVTKYGDCEVRRQAIAVKRRERGTVLSMEIAREMRLSGLSSRKAAAKWGVTQKTALLVMNNKIWREANVFSGLMAANSNWSKRA